MPESNKTILEEANAAIAEGNYEGFLAFCADDTQWTFVGDKTLTGKEAVRQWMAMEYVEPPQNTVAHMIAEGDFVVALGTITTKDEDGKATRSSYCDVWHFRGGKIAELWAFVITTEVKARTSARPRPEGPRRRRRGPWLTASILVAVMVAAAIVTTVFQFGLPWWMQEGDRNHLYQSDVGSLRYQVHLPPQYQGTTQLPMIMAIHGCGMTGYGWNSMKTTTQLNSLADREGFIVVYPTQRLFRSAINCWNSTDPREQHRYRGEPALLAGVARQVVEAYNADSNQVHVAGASSGAGAAVILAATYPDLFATVTSIAGGEYALNQVDPDDPGSTPPSYTARQAWSQMGDHARQVPLLVIQGEEDTVVPPLVATRLVAHWRAVGDFVDDGLLNDSLKLVEETITVPAEQDRHSYIHTTLTAADGTSLVEFYLVRDMGHVWPGPAGDGTYTDHAGPDASAILWDFAMRHPN